MKIVIPTLSLSLSFSSSQDTMVSFYVNHTEIIMESELLTKMNNQAQSEIFYLKMTKFSLRCGRIFNLFSIFFLKLSF